MTIPLALLLLAAAAGSGFDGRWNLQVSNEPRARVWWLEVKGSEGRFVGAPGGDMNTIEDLAIANGELSFSFTRNDGKRLYRARVENGRLKGTMTLNGKVTEWTGARAPVIPDQDDGSWKRGRPIELFNGKDLGGWSALIPGKPLGWRVEDGLLKNVDGANNLASDRKFWNFELHAEYKLKEHSNSGIGLRARYEIQIQDDFGKPADKHSHGALYSRVAPSSNPSKKPGEWQTLDIRLVGRTVTVKLNGVTILDKVEVEGLTAMASDPNEAAPGPITIQGDHREVEFRKLTMTPLSR